MTKIIGACSDGIIRVWTHDSEATRFAYLTKVVALIVHKDRVIASCRDGNADICIYDFTTTNHIADVCHHGSANNTSFMTITATDDTIFAGDYHGNIVSWSAKTFAPNAVIEPQSPSYSNLHKSPILALHCSGCDVLTAGKYITTSVRRVIVPFMAHYRQQEASLHGTSLHATS